MNNMHCRPMIAADLDQIMLLGTRAQEFYVTDTDHFWSSTHLKKWIRSPQDLALVVIDNEHIIGFLLASYHEPSQKLTLENIYVRDDYRQRGVGKMLMAELMRYAKKLRAKYLAALVSGTNTGMNTFIKKYGLSQGHEFYWYGKRLD